MRLFERERNLGFDVLRGHPEIGAAPCAAAPAEQAFEKVAEIAGASCAAKAVRKVREVHAAVSGAGWSAEQKRLLRSNVNVVFDLRNTWRGPRCALRLLLLRP